jgi:hypothetical protein
MTVVAQMLLTDPTPLMIWVVLLLSAMLAFLLLAKPDALVPVLDRHRARRAHKMQEAAHSVRYADELAMATQRSAQAADQWHTYWQQTEGESIEAWQAWQNAEERLARIRATQAFTMPAARTASEYADRERFLHRAVRVAVDRGDLPTTAIADALAERGGWNARLHPVDQELALCRAIVTYRHELHQRAAAAEEAAWHDTRLAFSARDRLRQEAAAAKTMAATVRHLVPVAKTRPATKRRLAVAQVA